MKNNLIKFNFSKIKEYYNDKYYKEENWNPLPAEFFNNSFII